ncbi:DUF4301 family protein [Muriicola soli]|uniref:DUF4301 family protein n=1 Tax=Muriicola soli TaxID=2507538 RepID=A0A411ECB1_9FLAO|nr:DUF4301 family protein [Muriicola soli]QBA65137.1 DUF4301 family protein [Muriicola soli]
MIEFTQNDVKQLEEKGISRKTVEGQIKTFVEGIPFINLYSPAVVGEGILKTDPADEQKYVEKFEASQTKLSLLKFVPASGAASRMFKSLFSFLDNYDPGKEAFSSYISRTDQREMDQFFKGAKDLPFYDMVLGRIKAKDLAEDKAKFNFVKELLSEDGLNYGFYPKGLLPFHKYDDQMVTAFEEHLDEAAFYAKGKDKAALHFTISEQHQSLFDKELKKVKKRASERTGTSFKVDYSYQSQATDTIAVTLENQPFRNEDNSVLFRPGGHGALIQNLNRHDADIIFIKNIDNVVTRDQCDEIARSKKVLAGVLIELQEKVFRYSKVLEDHSMDGEELDRIKSFLENDLNVRFSDNYGGFTLGQQIEILKDKLHRPIRVCGMVKNEGEPGGGPYWVRDRNGNISLQIVESAQVDLEHEHQSEIFKKATHFNPVDLVCGVKDFKGDKYDLLNFVDEKQGFITEKTKAGKTLKALELPGLWNGAMAYWNTIFVEVPSATFNPVKTVNDLLKSAHQLT